MDLTKGTLPMTTFRNHSAEIMRRLKGIRRPVTLTVNGEPAAMVQDSEACQNLLEIGAEAGTAEGIRQGEEDLRSGRTRPARDIFDEIRAEHAIQR